MMMHRVLRVHRVAILNIMMGMRALAVLNITSMSRGMAQN
jgi:hypothetical protein